MKKTIVFIMTLLLVSFFSLAQKPYSIENLEKTSQEELDVYFNKALKLQKNGKTVTIVGGSILGATVVSSVAFGHEMGMGVVILAFFGGVAGLGTMAVGIPMNITGKKRVERINEIRKTTFIEEARFEVIPDIQTCYDDQCFAPGVTIRIRF